MLDVDDISFSLRSNLNSLSNNSFSRFNSSCYLRLTGGSSATTVLNSSFAACIPTTPVVFFFFAFLSPIDSNLRSIPEFDLHILVRHSSTERLDRFCSHRLQCLLPRQGFQFRSCRKKSDKFSWSLLGILSHLYKMLSNLIN